jgi:hypothetical protein
MDSFRRRRRWNRRFWKVRKPQASRSVTLNKASLGAYSSYGRINMTCASLLHVMLCIKYRVLVLVMIGGMVVSFSILSLFSCIIFMTRSAMRS